MASPQQYPRFAPARARLHLGSRSIHSVRCELPTVGNPHRWLAGTTEPTNVNIAHLASALGVDFLDLVEWVELDLGDR